MDIEVKRGDAFSLDVTRVDANGNPVSLTGVTVTSEAKVGNFSVSFSVTMVNAAAGEFRLSATAAAAASWPVARLSADVKYDAGGGFVRRSKTFFLKVVQEITP